MERRNSSRGSLKFRIPQWKEIVLYDINNVKSRDFEEERAGMFFMPTEDVKSRHKPVIIIQSGPETRLETKHLKKLICYPNRGAENNLYRHQHELLVVNSNQDWVVWEGLAKFSYFIPDSPTSSVADLNVDDWMEIEPANNQPNNLFVDRVLAIAGNVNRLWPLGLLILGLGLLFMNPWLGLIVLGVAVFFLSRKKGGNSSLKLNKNSPTNSSGQKVKWLTWLWPILASLLIFKLWTIGSILLWPLALATLAYIVIGRNASWTWRVLSRILFWLLVTLSMLFLIGSSVGTETILPEERSLGVVRSERVQREGSDLFLRRHTIEWENPIAKGRNIVTYYTGENPYQASVNAHKSVLNISQNTSPLNYWGQVYAKLLAEDISKVDSLANIVYSVSKERGYSSLETAEYLVALIQEIPYVLVHDYSCQQVVNEAGAFVRDYHVQRKPCLSNVIAGVQSPYEFMHTLEGDCDTRSLLGHAILSRLGISSSVWVSEQYGHSILGIGVPSTSRVKKILDGVPHYGVELTAKGFKVGMISPGQMNMRNWDIAIFKNF